jgi:hypothetical protein
VERPGIALVGAEEAAQLGYSLSLLGLTVPNVRVRARVRVRVVRANPNPNPKQVLNVAIKAMKGAL